MGFNVLSWLKPPSSAHMAHCHGTTAPWGQGFLQGVEKVSELGSSDGCPTLNVLHVTELFALKWLILLTNCEHFTSMIFLNSYIGMKQEILAGFINSHAFSDLLHTHTHTQWGKYYKIQMLPSPGKDSHIHLTKGLNTCSAQAMKIQSWHATTTPTPASKGCHLQQVPGSGIRTGDKGPP